MASHKSVMHVQRGFRMSHAYAKQVMREHCTITWGDAPGTIRDTTDEERAVMRGNQMRQASAEAPLPRVEGAGLKFSAPKGTRYVAPRAAYDDQEWTILGHRCRWPRAA